MRSQGKAQVGLGKLEAVVLKESVRRSVISAGTAMGRKVVLW